MMLPQHQVLLLKQLCFFKLDIQQCLRYKFMSKQTNNSLQQSKHKNESNSSDKIQNLSSLSIHKKIKNSTKTTETSCNFFNRKKFDLITELQKSLQLFDSF